MAAVDSAEAERRRIERDLHDGAQQRLVALAMDLGRAREQLRRRSRAGPGARRRRPRRGQGGARRAARPRPRHPPGDPRPTAGLDAALSSVVGPLARPGDPVGRRRPSGPPAAVESTAYFVVSEALDQRGQARRRHQGVGDHRPRTATACVVEITDDGVGGADADRGSGLHGLRDRVAALGGWMHVLSPRRRADHHARGAPVRIVIAEDAVLLRAGLTRLLADAGEEVVAAVGDADALLDAVERHQPDLAIVDVRMPPTHTDEGLRAALAHPGPVARHRHPRALAVRRGARTPPSCWPATPAGIGYLLKDRVADVAEFLDAVRRVGDGGTALDPEVVAQLLARSPAPRPARARSPTRARGARRSWPRAARNAAIASALVVSDGAVEKHVSNIFTKLDLPPTEHDHRRVLAVLRWLES